MNGPQLSDLPAQYLTAETLNKLSQMKNPKEVALAILRLDLVAFFLWGMQLLNPGKEILDNWHIHHVAYQLQEMERGAFRRGLFAIPPRYAKTTMLSVLWHAWLLGHNPSLRLIAVSYAQDVAEGFAQQFRMVVEHERFKALFPGFVITKSTADRLDTDQHGYRVATSVEGQLTGIGGDWITADDLVKAKDAESEVRLKSVREWMQGTLFSRLDNKQTGRIIVTHQRLALLDPIGFLSASGGWTLTALPAIAETAGTFRLARLEGYVEHHRQIGEALHPSLEPLSTLEQIRTDLGAKNFNAQYQQRPDATGNALIDLDWLRAAKQVPPFDFVIMSVDPALATHSDADYSVIMLIGVYGYRNYVWHVERQRLAYPDLRARILQLAEYGRADVLLVEAVGLGKALFQDLWQISIEGKIKQQVVAAAPTANKVSRVIDVLPTFEKGEVWIPAQAKWLDTFKSELAAFPNGIHDDQIDALSQYLAYRWQAIDRAKTASVHRQEYERQFTYWQGKAKPTKAYHG